MDGEWLYADVASSSIAPRVTFTDPQVCAVGRTQQQARDEGLDVRCVAYPPGDVPGPTHWARACRARASSSSTSGGASLSARPFTGPRMQELLHSATIAISGDVTLDQLRHAGSAFPTVSEVWLHLPEAYGL